MNLRRFLADLKTRGVYRVAAFYVAGSWALLQVADVIFPVLGLPDWAITSLLLAAAIGFPIALGLAWFFDLTETGITETDTTERGDEAIALSPARVVEISVVATLALLVGYLYIERLAIDGGDTSSAGSARSPAERPAIAVMPFANLSGDPSADYLADGLAEEVLNLLSRLDELDVAARTSSFYYKGRDTDLREVGKQLAVSHVLEGSVRRAEGRVRVTAQLVDTRSGFRLWSQAFDRAYEDSFRLQDDVARQVVGKLQLTLSERSQRILDARPQLDPAAYDFYLRGREYLRASPSAESLGSAIAMFSRAQDLDASYASAYAGLCDAYLERYRLRSDGGDFLRGKESCERALTLSGDATAVLVALGNLYQVSGRRRQAQEHFEKALYQAPSNGDALTGLARNFQLEGNPDLAEATYLRAIKTDPNNWRAYIGIGGLLFNQSRFEAAIPYYERITSLVPDDATALNALAAAHYLLGNFDEAAATFARSLDIEPTALAYANSGAALFFLGRYGEAQAMYRRALELAPEDYENWGALADAYFYDNRRGGEDELTRATEMYAKAVHLARERLRINAQDGPTHALLAHYEARLGEEGRAMQSLGRALTLSPDDMYVHYNSALALTTLGQRKEALEHLRRAVDLGYAPRLIKLDAGFFALEALPTFERLVSTERANEFR